MYTELAAAFVRGSSGASAPDLPDEELIAWGHSQGLRLHKFKRTSLPRVRRVLGWLAGLMPADLLDIGPGRGSSLWPLLDAFRALPVTVAEQHPIRVRDLRAVVAGGIERLSVIDTDAALLSPDLLAIDGQAPHRDGATVLEVLEHVEDPDTVVSAVFRCTQRFVIVSVPSDPDDNPEHIRLFDTATLGALLRRHGAARIQFEHVLGHHLALAHLPPMEQR